MVVEQVGNLLIIGVTLGAVYAIMAMGLTFVYGVTKIFNYAQGAFYTWGGYFAWMLSAGYLHLPYPVVIILTILIMFLFGLVYEKALMYPLRRFKNWGMTAIVVTLGSALFLDNLAMTLFEEGKPKKLPYLIEGSFVLGEFVITKHEVVTLVAAIAITVLLALFLGKAKDGMAMRALTQDTTGARIVGIPVNRMFSYSFAIAAALGGISAILLAPKILVYPLVGWLVFIKAFVVMVFGGLGSIKGTVVAAFILAMVEAFVSFYVGAIWGMPVFIAALVIMLVFRPKGLFGT
jgi:branched-chain amino acid transport system permease protein